MRRLFLWLLRILPGAPLALLIGAAGVPPEDVLPNIAKWAKVLGIESPPQWLTAALIDTRIFWSAFAALISYVIFIALIHYVPRRPILAISGMLVIAAPVICWVLIGMWSANLFMECDLSASPTSFPSDGKIYNITIFSDKQPAVFGNYFGPPGAEFKIRNAFAYRCGVINYSNDPVFHVSALTRIAFIEAVSNGQGGQTSGNVIGYTDSIVEILRIDVGPERKSLFYIFNLSEEFFVRLDLPMTVSYHWPGSTVTRKTQLERPDIFIPHILSPIRRPQD